MEPQKRIRVLIADGHPIFRQGLRQVLESDPLIEIVAEAADGETALSRIQEFHPDIAVFDLDMPVMNGLAVAQYARQRNIPARLVLLTACTQDDVVSTAVDLGISGYVSKRNAPIEVLRCVKAVAAGEHYFCPILSPLLLKRATRWLIEEQPPPLLAGLTATERTILRCIAENKTSKEIAAEMFISYRTVENHRTNICTKLDLHGCHKLLEFALSHKHML